MRLLAILLANPHWFLRMPVSLLPKFPCEKNNARVILPVFLLYFYSIVEEDLVEAYCCNAPQFGTPHSVIGQFYPAHPFFCLQPECTTRFKYVRDRFIDLTI